MKLLEKIQQVLKSYSQVVETKLKYDIAEYVYGDVVISYSDQEQLNSIKTQIWETLKQHLEDREFHRIILLSFMRPEEFSRKKKMAEARIVNKSSRIWEMRTNISGRFLLLIDVMKEKEAFKTVFVVINTKINFYKATVTTYPKEVLEFLELRTDKEIKKELQKNALKGAEEEVRGYILDKYEELEKTQKLYGSDNPFMIEINEEPKPLLIREFKLDAKEIKLLQSEKVKKKLEKFTIYNYLMVVVKYASKVTIEQ